MARLQRSRLSGPTSQLSLKAGYDMPASLGNTENSLGEPIDFRTIYYAILEKRYLVLACVGAGLFAAAFYLAITPKIYAAQTIVQVEQAPKRVIKIEDVNSEDLDAAEGLKTIEQNLSNPALFQQVISTLHLDGRSLGLKSRKNPYTIAELTRALNERLSVKLLKGSRLITVTAENRSPQLAQQISLGVVNEYRRMNREQRLAVVTEANGLLAAEAARLKDKLQKSEQALQDYKEQKQAVSLQATQNITVEKLKELNAKLTVAKTERLKLEADVAQVQKLASSDPQELIKLRSVGESKMVIDQKKIVAEQEGLVANLSNGGYGEMHPKLRQARSQLHVEKADLNALLKRTAASVSSAYNAAKETEAKIEQALREQEQKALELNKLAIPYAALQREVESDGALYDAVLSRMKETDVTKSINQDDINVKSPATVPDRPVRPRKLLTLAGSVMAAFVLGVALVVTMRALDSSIRTVDEAEGLLGLPALAVIPSAMATDSPQTPLVIMSAPSGVTAEAFRTLRTSLSLAVDREKQSILFASALPDEGKTFCAINYAAACAQQNLRTLLIDGDLRLRSIGPRLLSDDTRPGVVDLLRKESSLLPSIHFTSAFDVCIQQTSIANLFVLTAGVRVPNPLEWLAGNDFHKLIEEAKGKFDRIIIDSAPVNAVSDSLLLVSSVNAVCFVLRAGHTPRNAAVRAVEKLEKAGASLLGFVLNRVPVDAKLAAYYGYTADHYGKGVYGAKEIAAVSEDDVDVLRAVESADYPSGYKSAIQGVKHLASRTLQRGSEHCSFALRLVKLRSRSRRIR
jgi:succinoglycan biosynthesis transport protein ExoP